MIICALGQNYNPVQRRNRPPGSYRCAAAMLSSGDIAVWAKRWWGVCDFDGEFSNLECILGCVGHRCAFDDSAGFCGGREGGDRDADTRDECGDLDGLCSLGGDFAAPRVTTARRPPPISIPADHFRKLVSTDSMVECAVSMWVVSAVHEVPSWLHALARVVNCPVNSEQTVIASAISGDRCSDIAVIVRLT